MTARGKKPFLVGDIGSTKSSWHLYDVKHQHFLLQGYNPVSQDAIQGKRVFEALKQQCGDTGIENIWYYGSGVTDKLAADTVLELLTPHFQGAKIHIHSDLEGAALAACGHDFGTIAILGTGSHAAVYDGQRIIRQASSLGYILGDEGGGSDIGKQLVTAFFYHEMPEDVRPHWKESIGTRIDFLTSFYHSPAPNQYLADLVKTAVELKDHPWISGLIQSRFEIFIQRHILPLQSEGPVHILGSIGCIFDSLMKVTLEKNGLSAGKFIRDPSHLLFQRHLDNDN